MEAAVKGHCQLRGIGLALATVVLTTGACAGGSSLPSTTRGPTTSFATTTSWEEPGTATTPPTSTSLATTTSRLEPATTSSTTTSVPSWWREVTPEAPLQVWVIGDSLAGPVGRALAMLAAESGLLRVTVHHEGGTGLARPDYFDWPGFLSEKPPVTPLDAIVVILGANDCQELRSAQGVLPFGTPQWDDRYRLLAGSFLSQVLSLASRAYWVGLPIMADADYDERVRHLNGLLSGWAAQEADLRYIEAYALFQDAQGRYAASLPDAQGNLVTVREADGLHYSTGGAQRMARRILEVLAGDWGLVLR